MKRIALLLVFIYYCEGYYWKEWNGSVPPFAVKAGRDIRGISYIAQAYVPNTGIYVGQIFPGQEAVNLNTYTLSVNDGPVDSSSYNIKVLCSDEIDLEWMASNFTRTPNILANERIHVIKSGIDNRNGTVYVGRYNDGDNIFIGSVHYDNFMFYATPNGLAKSIYRYELLVIGDDFGVFNNNNNSPN